MGEKIGLCARRFAAEMRVRGCKPVTVANQMNALRLFLQAFGKLEMSRLGRERIADFLQGIMDSGYSDHHKQYVRRVVKIFLKRFRGIEFSSFIKVSKVWSKLQAKDMVGRDELTMLIENLPTLQYKAMCSLLYDGALRRCELLGLRAGDIDMEHRPAHIMLHGKTEERTIPLTFSIAYLKAYLKAQRRLNNDSLLWSVGKAGLMKALRKAAKKAGIGKRIYPYLLRHSRLSELAGQNMRESLLKRYAGWTQDSPMVRNYVHIGSEELDRWVMARNQA